MTANESLSLHVFVDLGFVDFVANGQQNGFGYDKLQGPITPGITGLPWKACNKYTSDYPKTLNFGFCGEFHTQYGTNYNACFAQGDKSNWYMGTKDLTMKCHGGSSNPFDVQPNF